MKKKKLKKLEIIWSMSAEKIFSDEYFIDDVCLSYRHDFGLMNEEDKEKIRFQCKEWMRSMINNFDYHKYKLKK